MSKSHFGFKTKNENCYLYSPLNQQFLILNPIMASIVDSFGKLNLENSFANKTPEKAILEKIQYYERKYNLLKKNGYFEDENLKKKISGTINSDSVKDALVNTNQILFEVTDKCNLSCEYCAYGKFYNNYDKRTNSFLDYSIAETFLNYMNDFWNSDYNKTHNKTILLSFYGGEPLLNFDFIQKIVLLVQSSSLNRKKFRFSMTTNGLLLKKYIDFFVKHDFELLVSLDGNKANNSYRVFNNGKSAYNEIFSNILFVKEKYPKYFKKRVNFNSVLHNMNSYSEIIKYFKNNFDKIPLVSEVNPIGINPNLKQEFLKMYKNPYEDLRQSEDYATIDKELDSNSPNLFSSTLIIENYTQYKNKCFNNFFTKNNKKKVYLPTGTCMPFSKRIMITVNKKIMPCERIGHKYALGRINNGNVEIDFEKIAKIYNEYYEKVRKVCASCYNTNNCLQCIYHLNIDEKQIKCSGKYSLEDLKKYLSFHMSYLEDNPSYYEEIINKSMLS